jgi:RHS repeat-associated protein
MRRAHITLFLFVLLSLLSCAQVQTGTPPFGSFGGGPFDTINLANLNVHLEFPIFSRPGRGMSFSYALKYDNSFWYPTGTSPNMTWSASYSGAATYGWSTQTDGLLGSISLKAVWNTRICGGAGGTIYNGFRYTDSKGSHPFTLTFSDCGWNSYTVTATDGSGIVLSVTTDLEASVTLPSGIVISPPVNSSAGPGSITDTNGNVISSNGTQLTDTIDSGTSHVLTISGAAPTVMYNYPGPSGSIHTTASYTSFNVVTNFSCTDPSGLPMGNAGVTASLITQIQMPDLSAYSITYEQPAGFASGYTTGRISEIGLPTGGKITYSYGSINCADGRVTSLTRTVYKDATTVEGVWTYTRPANSNTTRITDAATRDTVIDFQDIYETRRRIYSGAYDANNQSAGLVQTLETCYNGAAFPCTNTAVSSSIVQVNRRLEFASGKNTETDSFYNSYGLPYQVDEYDFWTSTKPAQPLRRTTTSYASLVGIVGRPSLVQVVDGNSNPVAKTSYAYDEGMTGVHGNLTTMTRYTDAAIGHALVENFTYNANGLLATHTMGGNQTTYTYSQCNNSLLTQVSMPLNLTRSQQWNCDGGVVTSTTDENLQPTTYIYGDPSRWSPTEIDYPGGAQTNYSFSSSVPWTVSTTQKIDVGKNLALTTILDGLGRTSKQELTSDPNGTVITDTQYDAMGRIWKVSNPYLTTNDPSYGNNVYAYDALGRTEKITHPDGSSASTSYSEEAQTIADEVGHQRRFVSDGLGRLVRVDEPGQQAIAATPASGSFTVNGSEQSAASGPGAAGTGSVTLSGSLQNWQTQTAAATTASGSVTVNGSLQSKQVVAQSAAAGAASISVTGAERSTQVTTQNATTATGSVTISGAPQHKKVFDPDFGDWYYVDNLGPVSVTVNGFTKSASANTSTSTSSVVASNLASAFNADGNSPVTASASGSVVYLTSKATGAAANYSLSTSCSYDSTYFTACAFTGAPSGAALTGGQNAIITTVYDTGTASLTVNGLGKSVPYAQSSSTSSVASALVNAFNADGSSPVTAGLSGSTIVLTAKQTGAATNYAFSTSASTNSGYFSGSSFAASPGSGSLSGGRDTTYNTVYDSGTISVSVNGYNKSTTYGSGSSASTMASTLASAFTNDGASPVTASAAGGLISFTTRQLGSGVNYSLASSSSYDTGNFSGPSFTTSNSGGSLTGGQNAQYRTDYDSGTTTVIVNGQSVPYSWSGTATSTSSIASGVAAAINSSSSYATATSTGATVYLTARTVGAATNYSLSTSTSSSHNSFSSSPSGSAFVGGSDIPFTYDTGTVSVTVGGSNATVSYNSGSTAASIASSLSSQLSPSVVSVSVSGSTVNLTSLAVGSQANLSLSASSSTNLPGTFAQPAFTVSRSGATLTGGADATLSPYSLSTPTITLYSFNLQNRMTGVNQSSQTRAFGFDWLGRMTSEINPETGTVTYSYDSDSTCGASAGDPVKRVDAVGNVTCLAYDPLHRNTAVTYPSGTYSSVTPEKHFVYDSATVNGTVMANAHGRLVEAYTGPSTGKITDLGYSYSERGAVADVYEATPHSGGWFHVSQSYWQNDAIKKLSGIPGVPDITYNPDAAGRITTVTASSGQNPVTLTSYNVAGQLTGMTFGSGDSDSYQYQPKTGRMTQYQFNVNGQYAQGSLAWNDNGSLQQLAITDQLNASNSQTCTYSHDGLGRISNVDCGAVWQQAFGFDAFGNLRKTGSQSFTPAYDTASNRISGGGYSAAYDANGNTTNDGMSPGAITYTWDADGNPVTITGGSAITVIYDAMDRAVENQNGSSYTQIVYGPDGNKLALMNGTILVRAFVALPGNGEAVYTASGLAYYRHADWLGSSRVASTPSRTVYFDGAYAPFGEAYAWTGTADLSFTGQTQDTLSGLHDFMFRRYNPVNGRWVSPDPAGLAAVDPMNPQSWNRYAYVGNSPTNFVDPLGLCAPILAPTGIDGGQVVVGCRPDFLDFLFLLWNGGDSGIPRDNVGKAGNGKPSVKPTPISANPVQQQCLAAAAASHTHELQEFTKTLNPGQKINDIKSGAVIGGAVGKLKPAGTGGTAIRDASYGVLIASLKNVITDAPKIQDALDKADFNFMVQASGCLQQQLLPGVPK